MPRMDLRPSFVAAFPQHRVSGAVKRPGPGAPWVGAAAAPLCVAPQG